MIILVLVGIAIAIFRSVEAAAWFAIGAILAIIVLGSNIGRLGV